MKHIPNIITSLNLTSGFIAIIFAANGNIESASWFILAAMIFDFLDGFFARLLKAYSEVGKELDSLADLVSFGVAPGLIIYRLLFDSFSMNVPTNLNSESIKAVMLMVAPAIMVICAAIRLAKFNLDPTQSTSFKGMPTPANAIAVISIIIPGQYTHSSLYNSFTDSPFFILLFTILLSLLMVSRIPLLSLKITNLRFKGNEGRFILVLSVIIGFLILGPMGITLIVPLYIISSLISLLF
jgi:CDP-diacylglycerol---serine O-phosphatidyltransferase